MTENITFPQLHWQAVTSSNSSLILLLLIVLEATQQRFVNVLTVADIDMPHTPVQLSGLQSTCTEFRRSGELGEIATFLNRVTMMQ